MRTDSEDVKGLGDVIDTTGEAVNIDLGNTESIVDA